MNKVLKAKKSESKDKSIKSDKGSSKSKDKSKDSKSKDKDKKSDKASSKSKDKKKDDDAKSSKSKSKDKKKDDDTKSSKSDKSKSAKTKEPKAAEETKEEVPIEAKVAAGGLPDPAKMEAMSNPPFVKGGTEPQKTSTTTVQTKCLIHGKDLQFYCENTESLICYDCTVMGPHNTQLHRISKMDEAFAFRF